uniref:Uncharacterized protein n=1 Tax=Anguilla anguilla TaxID=7936 RepID=A0A0E9X310_ANGAN
MWLEKIFKISLSLKKKPEVSSGFIQLTVSGHRCASSSNQAPISSTCRIKTCTQTPQSKGMEQSSV